jgi:hypothetical protein
VTARSVANVVGEAHGLQQGGVEAYSATHRGGDLRHLERMGEPGALVVCGEDEDLRLAGEAPESRRVQHPVSVALEARAEGIGLLRALPSPRALRPRSLRG